CKAAGVHAVADGSHALGRKAKLPDQQLAKEITDSDDSAKQAAVPLLKWRSMPGIVDRDDIGQALFSPEQLGVVAGGAVLRVNDINVVLSCDLLKLAIDIELSDRVDGLKRKLVMPHDSGQSGPDACGV